MVITVECPSCNTSFPVDSAKIPEGGVRARCSTCGNIFRVERPAEEAAVAWEPKPAPSFDPPTAAEETGAADLPSDWVIEREEEQVAVAGSGEAEAPSFRDEPSLQVEEPSFEVPEEGLAAGAEPAAEPEPVPPPEVPGELVPPPEVPGGGGAPAAPETPTEPETAAPVKGFTFGKRDPAEKARRLARVLVSDMIMYNPERHEKALAEGTLKEDFEDEIEKSWKEYVEQVGEEMAEGDGRSFWSDALNDVLAKGQEIF